MGGLLGLIYAIACIVAIVDCLKSGKETKDKIKTLKAQWKDRPEVIEPPVGSDPPRRFAHGGQPAARMFTGEAK